MVPQRYLRSFPLLLSALLAVAAPGCSESPTGPSVNHSIPLGRWKQVRFITEGGRTLKLESRIELLSQSKGTVRDSIFRPDGTGSWTLDSVAEIQLAFTTVGDGYQRATEIVSAGGAIDTTVGYWYFFKRDGLLYHYRGMRFLGSGTGLAGRWTADTADSVVSHRWYVLEFKGGHLRFEAAGKNGAAPAELPYVVSGDTLDVADPGLPFGDRYEIFPGWCLYITNHATEGYSSF